MKEDGKTRKTIGSIGEDIAAAFLQKNGAVILQRNFRFSRFGEIDIVSRENEYICFTEVKTRTSSLYGAPSEAVVFRKQESIRSLAQIYLKIHHQTNSFVRFDVIEVILNKTKNGYETVLVNVIKNAF